MATKLEKAKAVLVLDHPFFASLLLKYPIIERKDIPTLAVDKRGQIYYNAEFVETLTVPQLVWGLCHEIGHKIGHHAQRMDKRDHKKWNIAGDAWINDMLSEAKVGETIPGCVNMPGSKDDTVENIYDKLPDSPNGGQGGSGLPGDGLGDDLLDEGAPMTEAEVREMEANTKVDLAQAAQAARMKGKLSAGLARIVDEIINVTTPWQDILERFMINKVKNESSWNRPNRRFIGHDIYLPSMDSVGTMGELVIGVDTSGSIQNRELQHFGAHVNRIIDTCKPEKVTVIYCDAEVNHVDEFAPDEYPVKFKPHGGGGTDLVKIMDYITEKGINPVATVIFTDGYTPFPESVDHPTIWAMTTGIEAPISAGETIHFDMN